MDNDCAFLIARQRVEWSQGSSWRLYDGRSRTDKAHTYHVPTSLQRGYAQYVRCLICDKRNGCLHGTYLIAWFWLLQYTNIGLHLLRLEVIFTTRRKDKKNYSSCVSAWRMSQRKTNGTYCCLHMICGVVDSTPIKNYRPSLQWTVGFDAFPLQPVKGHKQRLLRSLTKVGLMRLRLLRFSVVLRLINHFLAPLELQFTTKW